MLAPGTGRVAVDRSGSFELDLEFDSLNRRW
jgi:hypothetical protein